MSTNPHRLSRKSDFTRTLRSGVRVSRGDVVVHLYRPSTDVILASKDSKSVALQGGPRFGYIVSKTVGNAVTRHAVTRKLRVACQRVVAENALAPSSFVVIRALASSATASTAELSDQVQAGIARCDTRLSGRV